ncbi:MAG: undecaprenyldiphospho-muramoylpentapeptide beta-N-acetylglucosaminyltransferase, partial [Candidatus Omnitrophica bacterium]|nr:undecaprenyldiphospho-muramoylpentapeptide beta-N-acetylglucosaminyltransferase [Candidatus Omnitrophota bacterium]
AAGGSGGHIFPATALAAKLANVEAEVVFVSSKRQLDRSMLSSSGYRCYYLSVNPMPHKLNAGKLIVFLAKFAADTFYSAWIVMKERPNVVVGFGGYSSGAISLLSRLFGRKLVIHEQNYFPGRAIVILSRIANLVALSFKGTEKYLPGAGARTVLTGNPLRTDILLKDKAGARERMGLASGKKCLLVMGGSQGASSMNRLSAEAVIELSGRNADIQVIHLTGKRDHDAILKFYEDNGITSRVFSFLDRMSDAYSAADAAVSRSGASAVFELAYYGLPMVLVPYPNPKNNQRTNARFFEEKGAAIYREEKDISASGLASDIEKVLFDEELRIKMGRSALEASLPDAAKRLADEVIKLVKRKVR